MSFQISLENVYWYHELIRYANGQSFWDICPEYFKENLDEMREEVDYLHIFLTQDRDENKWSTGSLCIRYQEGSCVLLSEFKKKFLNYMRFSHPGVQYKWTSDYSAFKHLGYEIERVHTCKACLKSGGNCCLNYNRANRSKKTVIKNMILDEMGPYEYKI
jgi:hypothetical protein